MADMNARQDQNQFPALIAHTGTAGTAETVRVVADSAGNLMVNLAAGEEINIGTLTLGTINLVKAGTISKVEGGSIVVTAGTVTTTMGDLSGGTLDLLSDGTVQVKGGSVVVTAGTTVISGTTPISGTVTETTLLNAKSDNAIGISGAKYSLQSHFEGTTGWTSGTTVANFGVSTQHRGAGTNSLEFDKIAGDTSVMISKTIDAFDMSEYSTHAIGVMSLYVSDLTNVDYVFARIGTDSSNYCQWNFDGGLLTEGWNQVDENILQPTSQTGNGYNLDAITYIAFGVVFDSADNTLVDIRTCSWGIKRVLEVAEIVAGDVQVDSPNLVIKDQNSNTRLDVAKGATYNYLYSRNTDGQYLTPAGDGTARPIYTQVAAGSAVITAGTISTIGTLPNIPGGTIGVVSSLTNGSIVVTNGTVASVGTVPGVGVIGNLNSGTLAAVTSITNLASGTVAEVTLMKAGTVSMINAGTITSVGTVPGVGVIGNVNAGTIGVVSSITNLASGTVAQVTSVSNIASGTLAAVTSVTNLASGTLAVVSSLTNGSVVMTNGTVASVGTVPGVGIVGNVNGGSIVITAGTISTQNTVGTVGVLNAGSIVVTAGTITAGTVKISDPLTPIAYDNIAVDYTDGTTETYVFNSGTVPQGTITLVYLDAAKGSLSTVTKS